MDKKIVMMLFCLQLMNQAYSQEIIKDQYLDTLRYDVNINHSWRELVNRYLKDTGFLKQSGVISLECSSVGETDIYVIGGIGSRKFFTEKIPSFYCLISNQVVLIYTGFENKMIFPKEYIDEISKVCFSKLDDDLKENIYKDPKHPNFKPIPLWAAKSYDVEMWRIEMKDGKIVKKEITNSFLFNKQK